MGWGSSAMDDAFPFRAIGQPLPRKEDERLLRGEGRFSDDVNVAGQAYAVIVRSPYPHARIRGIDKRAALALPGVLAVLAGADAAADGLAAIDHSPVPSTRYDMKLTAPGGGPIFVGPHLPLPADKVRHVGEAVALVVAETLDQAKDGAEAVAVAYEELPWTVDVRAALAPGAAAVWDEVPGNLFVDTWFGDRAATDRAFAEAAHVVRMRTHLQRVTATAIEPRAALAVPEADGRLTLHAGSGGAVRQKRELAAVLGIAPERLRVVANDVGGNFGSRNRTYVEFALVLWAARRLGRPVKYTAERGESLLTDYQGRDLLTSVELALAADGRFLAMRADNVSNAGARCVSLSPLGKGAGLITGSYHIPAASLRARAVFTNTMPTQAYRSSGRPEVTCAIERLVDRAALAMGMDRVALRRMNLVRPEMMPYQNAVGAVYDSGTYAANLDRALALADWQGFPARRAASRRRGRLRGIGLANYVESSIGAPRERAEIAVSPEGLVRVVIGTQPSGQGHETSFAQVVSDLLWVPVERVSIVMGDTDVVSVGGGSHSGRSMRHAGVVIGKAADALLAQARTLAATLLERPPAEVACVEGRFAAPGGNRSLDLADLAREAAARGWEPLATAADNEMHEPVFPNGCAVCEIEIDPDTGAPEIVAYSAVDDVGRCINPLIVEGQTHGGIAQGVGQALWEQCAIDPVSGQPCCGSLMDYALPRADSLPSFATAIVEVLSPTNPLGIKAGGEGGTTPALAAVTSAVADALAPLGIHDIAMPATALTIWQAIRDAE